MNSIDFKKHKLFLVETIIIIVVIVLCILGGIYSIVFPVIDDVRRKDFDTDYVAEIYSADKEKFNKMAELIDTYNIKNISHSMISEKSEKYFYKDTLYYNTNSELSADEKDNITALAYELFDKYDFDDIDFSEGEISFTYANQAVSLVYCKNKTPYIDYDEELCNEIAPNWYIVS